MAENVRLCMIGAGGHSSASIYPCFHRLRGVEVVANADLDIGRARSVGGRFGISRSYDDYHPMLEAERPDGVVICVNSTFHPKAAVELLERGYHVYVEKPTCNTFEQARAMLEASRKHGRVCMTAYKKRFAPAYAKAKTIIESGDFGRPTLLTLLRTRGPHTPTNDPVAAYLLQWGCHVVDLVCYLFGEVAAVTALKTGESPHAYAVTFRFCNDAIGTFAVTDRIKGRNWEQVVIVGSEGVSIQVENSTEMIAAKHNQPFAAHKPDFVSGASNGFVEQGYVGELQAFVDAIRTGEPPEANIQQGAHTMAVYEAIQRSAEQNGAMTEVAAL